ncbi:MAG: dockerin type I domain-containing protein [Caldilineaceae bacterium]
MLVVDGNKAFTANFGPASYTISTTVSGNGAITLNPDKGSYSYGEVVQVTATPGAEWSFAEWGLGLSGNVASQSLTVTDNTNVEAIFAPTTYALNVAWIGDGTAQKLTDKTTFTTGEVVTVTATPGAGAVNFAGWRNEESDTFFSTALTTTVTITGDRSIVAIFGEPLYPLTVNIVGSGTVTPTNGLYALGDMVTLTATAASGWSFAAWSGDVISTSNPLSLTIDGSTVVTATFVEDVVTDYYSLTVNIVGNGVVTPTSGSYISGTVVPITATAAVDWSFSGWSGDLGGNANPTSLTLDGNKIITATFTVDVVLPPGDVNADTAVNVIDLQAMINMILHGTQPDDTLFALDWWQRADLNNDGQWNVIDLQLLINLIQAAP